MTVDQLRQEIQILRERLFELENEGDYYRNWIKKNEKMIAEAS